MTKFKRLSVIALSGFAVLSCGKGSDQQNQPPQLTGGVNAISYCPSGQIEWPGRGCKDAALFSYDCDRMGGYQTPEGYCRFTFVPGIWNSVTMGPNAPVLNPGDLYGMRAAVAITARAGDRVYYQATSESAWTADEKFFTTCNSTTLEGVEKSSSERLSYSGQPQGIFLTDGVTPPFYAGYSKEFQISSDSPYRQVRIGLNAPFVRCSSISALFTILRCMDRTGRTYPCS